MSWEFYEPFALALGLGLLVGLQRQWMGSEVAGIRTFPLITLMGTMAATVAGGSDSWPVAAGLLALAGVLIIANIARIQRGDEDASGMTTEAAALLMYLVGVGVASGHQGQAIVTAGLTAVLLHLKTPMHRFVERIGEQDFKGLIQLVLIALVILPLLPDQTYGPYDVLNPYKIWMMVVLIVSISLAAYVASKLVGARSGAILGGVLGGLISSTATTVSYARLAKGNPDIGAIAAVVILIASTIVNVRVLIEVGVVSQKLLAFATLPLAIMMLVMVVECLVLYWLVRSKDTSLPDHDNPAQLKPALLFAALYAVILFVVAWAKDQFGTGALYGIAVISGLTDVDAITLSTAHLFNDGRVEGPVAWRVILIATMSNLVFKGAAVAVLGNRKLFVRTAVAFGIAIAGGIALLLFWPDIEISFP